MKYSFRLEAIGDDRAQYARLKRNGQAAMRPESEGHYLSRLDYRQPWVARLLWLALLNDFERVFLRGQRDYREANGSGSRGVYLYYLLDEGPIYEVFARRTWTRSERYFLKIAEGKEHRLSREEVVQCLSASAASA